MQRLIVGRAQKIQREVNLPKTSLLSLSENGQVKRRCRIMWQFATVIGVSFSFADEELQTSSPPPELAKHR